MNSVDKAYLDALRTVMEEGTPVSDRTGVGVVSVLGQTIRFRMSSGVSRRPDGDYIEGFPLLTSKKVFWKGIVHELHMFLTAGTDSKPLEQSGVNIWKGNSTREFLDQRNLNHYREGELGPVYGFQWRHFGAEYKGPDAQYHGLGRDQLRYVIQELKERPNSRRAIVSAWNPCQLEQMCIPPCHVLYHFTLRNGELCLNMYQRSGDMFLGIPFNMASCAFLVALMSRELDAVPGTCVIHIGDAHVYQNHIDAVNTQLQREPVQGNDPCIRISPTATIDSFTPGDVDVVHYTSHPTIKAPMAV